MISKKIFRFAMVGVVNTLIDFIVFLLLIHKANFDPILANILAFLISATNSFFMNSRWTFGVKNIAIYRISTLYIHYLLVNSIGVLISTTSIFFLSKFVTVEGAKLIAILLAFAWNFTASNFLIFTNKK